MCYTTEQKGTAKELRERFHIAVDAPESLLQSESISGFSHPAIPIITNAQQDIITTNFTWGLVPSWANDTSFRKNTLNARLETVHDKPSFKDIVTNRCLIIATAYYEWRWLDVKGNKKEKFRITSANDSIFTFAGLYTIWTDKSTGLELGTYTMLTTSANPQMAYVHNIKQRMPILLHRKDEFAYLNSEMRLEEFGFPSYDPGLVTESLGGFSEDLRLF